MMNQSENGITIRLNPYQHNFIYSKKRHPAGVMGWGAGKTLCAIARSLIYSKLIPENLGVIFRKTAKSLSDSTLRDFERYTHIKVDSQRNYTWPNKSTVMFRHIDEIGDINQQNINLGWFYIEQGDELETDKEFFMLFGRLRRKLTPSEDFLKLGLPVRSGWIIANAGDHWMRPLWKEGGLDRVVKDILRDDPDLNNLDEFQNMTELIEATTFDNIEAKLPPDYLASLRLLERTKPEIYRQFVLNDWNITQDRFVLLKREQLNLLEGIQQDSLVTKRVISIDPSEGGDACVIMALENNRQIDKQKIHVNDTMKIVGEALIMGTKHNCEYYAGDAIGNGKGVFDRLAEMGKKVLAIKSSEASSDPERYFNLRSEMWCYLQDLVIRREIPPIEDQDVVKQVLSVRYDPKAVNSRGRMKIVPKDETKKLIGHSPDDADAFVYGLWALKDLNESNVNDTNLRLKKFVFHGAGGW